MSSAPAVPIRIYDTTSGLVLQHGERFLDLNEYTCTHGPIRHGRMWSNSIHSLHMLGLLNRAKLLEALQTPGWREVPNPLTSNQSLLVPQLWSLTRKILALGKNFHAHAAEFGEAVPEEPLFFNKLPETLVPHGSTVSIRPWYTQRVDHEAELAVILSQDGADIPLEHAMNYVAGYSIANDLTARSLQGQDRNLKYPWFRAKNMDGFCPLGPCFVPRDFLDLSDLLVTCTVRHADGSEELRQSASTKDLIVDVPHAISWLSRHLTLRTGDILLMGTPAGVGPLVDGDTVTCAIEGIGELVTRIARPAQPA